MTTPVNKAPKIFIPSEPKRYVEGDAPQVVQDEVRITDSDGTTLVGARVFFTRGFNPSQDILGFTAIAGITGTWDAGSGSLTFTGTASIADYQALLRSITYLNTSDNPDTTPRRITFEVDDGRDYGKSLMVSQDVQVRAVNDKPYVADFDGLVYTQREAMTPMFLESGITLNDPDSAFLTRMEVRITGGYRKSDDFLAATVKYPGISAKFDPKSGTLTFIGKGTVAQYEALLRGVTFRNDEGPGGSITPRTVTIRANDGSGMVTLGSSSIIFSAPAVLGTDGASTAWTEGAAAVAVDGSVTVSDIDDANLLSATVTITAASFQAGDALNFVDASGITGSYNAATGVLTLSGTASLAAYQAALRSITFSTSNDDPSSSKTVEMVVYDGDGNSNTLSRTVNITAVNDAPVVSLDGTTSATATLAYTENGAAATVAPNATLADPDSHDFGGGSLRVSVTSALAEDQLTLANQGTGTGQVGLAVADVSYGGVVVGTLAGGADGADLVVSFNTSATREAVEAVMRAVQYANTSDNPAASRTLTFTVIDGDGGTDSGASTATVNITATNDGPVVTLAAEAAAVTEGSAVAVDGALTVTDPDSADISGGIVAIIATTFQDGDVLDVAGTANIGVAYDADTGVLTLTGTDTLANYQALLRAITFSSSNDDPVGTKTIEFQLNDGTDDGPVGSRDISVTPVNDAPVLALGSPTPAYTENGAALVLAPSATLTEPDNDSYSGGTLNVSFTAGGSSGDVLSIRHVGNADGQIGVSGSTVSYAGTAIGTLAGGTTGDALTLTFASGTSREAVEALVKNITYRSTSDDPSTTDRTVSITVTDGGGTANSGADSDTETLTLTVTAVNDAPVIAGTSANAAYTEGGAAVAVDAGLTLTDPDDVNLEGAEVKITGNLQTGDLLAVTGNGTITGSYDADTGILTLSGSDTKANYQAVLRTVTFSTTHDDPAATRTIEWSVDDGSVSSSAFTRTIDVTPVNDAPEITAGGTLSYTENDDPTAIDTGITLSDADSANFSGGSLTVAITANGSSADQLGVLNLGTGSGQISVASTTVSYEGTAIGTITSSGANGGNLVISFGSATPSQAAVQALMRAVAYSNNSDDPATAARVITFTVVDGDGEALGGDDDSSATATVNFTAVNDEPEVTTTTGAAAYTEDGSAVAVDGALTLTVVDPDDTNMESATVSIISNLQSGDVLNFVDISNITGSYDAVSGVLTLTGTDTKANYEAALRSITFSSTQQAPATSKIVEFVVDDGDDSSPGATRSITVTPVNDAPDVSTSAAVLAYTENGAAAAIAPAATVTDIDSTDFNGGSLSVAYSANGTAADQLSVLHIGNGAGQIGVSGSTVSYGGVAIGTINAVSNGVNGVALVVNLNAAAATPAAVQALAQAIAFANTSDNPSTAARTLTFTVNDGDGGTATDSATATVNLTAVNDAPLVTASGGTTAFTEGDVAVAVDGSITVTDVDSANLSSATVQITGDYQSGSDTLAFTGTGATGNIAAGAFDAGTGTLTLTSSGGTATALQWQAALRLVQFDSTSGSPGPSREISFQLDDGDGGANLSTVVTKAIAITEVNSKPTITLSGGAGSFTEDGGAVVIDNLLAVSDSDTTTLSGATVQITTNFTSAEDLLVFVNTANITGSYNATTGILTLSGTDTLDNYRDALRTVSYNNTSDTPNTATRTFAFRVDDGQGVDNLSDAATRDMTVAVANDPPVLAAGGTLNYTENGAAAKISPVMTVADPDSGNFDGGTLTAGFTANGTADDQLAVSNDGTGAGQIGVSGANITYGGTVIGTVAGGANGTNLVVTLNASATAAAVTALTRAITFANSSENPSALARTVTYALVDGDGGSDTGSTTATVNVTNVNDAPVLQGTAVVGYTEDAAPTILNAALTVSDIDSASLTSATVDIGNGFVAGQDVLTFTDTANITGSYNAATGVLSTTGTASVAEFQTFLRGVGYQNSSQNPSTVTRAVNFQVSDGAAVSNVEGSSVTVTAVNDAPTISGAGNSAAFTENGVPLSIDSALTLSDPESDGITGATVSIGTGFASGQDVLSFVDSGADNITGSYDAATGVLTFSGTDTLANYEAALESVTYQNTSDNPSTAARTITYQVTDNGTPIAQASVDVTGTVNVTAVNDAPVNTVPANASLGTAMSNVDFAVTGVSIADVDAGAADLQTTITVTNGTVNFSLAGGATVAAGGLNTATVTLQGTVTEINAALSTFTFRGTDGIASPVTANVTVTTNDMGNTGIEPASGGTGTATTEQDSDSFQIGVIPQVFVIDNAGGATTPLGTLFPTIAGFNASSADGTNDVIYLRSGTYAEADGINLGASQTLIGQGEALSYTNPVTGAIVTFGAAGAAPMIDAAGAVDGITLASNNTVRSLNIDTNAVGAVGVNDSGATVGSLAMSNVNITGSGQAFIVDNGGTLTVTLGTVTSSGGAYGVKLGGGMTGSFSATGGTLSGQTTSAFDVSNGDASATVSYAGTIGNGVGSSVTISDLAGSATFSGNITDTIDEGGGVTVNSSAATVTFSGATKTLNTGASGAVNLTNNTGTVHFTGGGLDIDTMSGAGFRATGGGTVNLTGGTNTVTTTTGVGVEVSNTTIGASGMTFVSVSTNGATNGIVLNTTGSGAFTVTGDGSNARNASGGTIQNTTDDGISLTNAGNVTLRSVSVISAGDSAPGTLAAAASSAGEHGIYISGGSNYLLSGVLVDSPSGSGIVILNVGGTNRVNADSMVTGVSGISYGMYAENVNTNMTLLQLDDIVMQNGSSTTSNVYVANTGSSSFRFDVRNSTFENLNNQAITAAAGGSTTTSGTLTTSIEDNVFQNAMGTAENNVGILVGNGATHTALVDGNTFDNIAEDGSISNTSIIRTQNSGGVMNATVTNNTIQNITYATGGRHVIGHVFEPVSYSPGYASNLNFSNNSATNVVYNGGNNRELVFVDYRANAGGGDVTVNANSFTITSAGAQEAFEFRFRQSNVSTVDLQVSNNTGTINTANAVINIDAEAAATVNATVFGNNIANSNGTPGAGLALASETAGTSTLNANVYSNTFVGGIDLAQVGTLVIRATNQAALSGANNGAAVTAAGAPTYNAGASVPTPSLPPTPPSLLLASTEGPAADAPAIDAPSVAWLLEAAIMRWAAAGATEAQLLAMASTPVSVSDLGGALGMSSASGIVLDDNGAGHGWYLDLTPGDDSEFFSGSVAGMDLLTVLVHEYGHVLGFDDIYGDHAQASLFYGFLDAGERRMPDTGFVAADNYIPADFNVWV